MSSQGIPQAPDRGAGAKGWALAGPRACFPSTVGTPLDHHNLARSFKDLQKRAGLPQSVRLCDLRHTCATRLLGRNVHPKYVEELLGHASITFTLDTYSHVLPGMQRAAADDLDAALFSQEGDDEAVK